MKSTITKTTEHYDETGKLVAKTVETVVSTDETDDTITKQSSH